MKKDIISEHGDHVNERTNEANLLNETYHRQSHILEMENEWNMINKGNQQEITELSTLC